MVAYGKPYATIRKQDAYATCGGAIESARKIC
jgi:hypothetical protein